MLSINRNARNSSLLDKLKSLDSNNQVGIHRQTDTEVLLSSIKCNLQRILNIRKGGASSDIEMGLADFNDAQLSSRDVISNICKDIEHTIDKYEQRLTEITVLPNLNDSTPLKLSFRILASVFFSGKKEAVEFNLLIEKGHCCNLR